MDKFADRRRSQRIEILDRIHGHVAALDVAVTVREMSLHGMSVETTFPFPEGAVHLFRLVLGDGTTTDLSGRVVRCTPTVSPEGVQTFVSGIQFTEDDSTQGDGAVGNLIDKIS